MFFGFVKIIIYGFWSWRLIGLIRVMIFWVMRWSFLFFFVVLFVWWRWVFELVDVVSLMESGLCVVFVGLFCIIYI